MRNTARGQLLPAVVWEPIPTPEVTEDVPYVTYQLARIDYEQPKDQEPCTRKLSTSTKPS